MMRKLLYQIRLTLPPPKSVVAFVGAGGKTTCIYQLARLLIDEGAKVLITTTTRLFHPEFEQRENWELKLGLFHRSDTYLPNENGKIDIVAAGVESKTNKLIGYAHWEVDETANSGRYDYVLVEADGAKRKSIKAPAEHEPVVPDATTLTIGVIGLTCLGYPLDISTVHRPELLAKLAGQHVGSIIDENTLKKLIVSKKGLFKGTARNSINAVVLNKADTPILLNKGIEIQEAVMQAEASSIAIKQVLVGSLKP